MEARTITIISESSNGHKTIQSSAETLRELKRDLTQNGIDYSGKVFREGLSRTELVDDASVLPSNLMWKGEVTNNLVFTLITEHKKIKSGAMTRAEAYAAVKEANLQGTVKVKFGKNFTQVGTADLEALLAGFRTKAPKETPKSEEAVKAEAPQTCPLEGKFEALLNLLVENDVLEEYEVEELRSSAAAAPAKKASDSPYSEAELRSLTMR